MIKRQFLIFGVLACCAAAQIQDIPGSEAVGASRQKIVDNFNYLNAGKASLSMGGSLPGACTYAAAGPVVLFIRTSDDTLHVCEVAGWRQVSGSGGTGGPIAWGSVIGTLADQADLAAALAGKAQSVHSHSTGDITSGVLPMSRLASSGSCDANAVLWGDARCAPPPSTAAQVGAIPATDKGQANGVATLDSGSKVPMGQIPTGQTGSTVALGNDARFSNARTPTTHAATHGAGQSDAVSVDAGQVVSGTFNTSRIPDLSSTYAKVSDKTGGGAKIASASVVPGDGCASWSSGNIGSTGQPCGTGSGGEANTASNQGSAGVGTYYQKSGVDLQFHKLNPASNKLSITLDAANHKIDFDVATANLGLSAASVGLANVPNVDATNATNINSGTLAPSRIGDLSSTYQAVANKGAAGGYAPLDGSAKVPIAQLPTGSTGTTVAAGNDARLSDARTPTAHAPTHKNGGADEIATAVAAANAIPKAGAGGTLASGWLPIPGAASLGGVQSKAATSHYFLTGISAADGSVSAATIGQSDLPLMTGDSGTGGAQGAVPAPAAGDAAKFLTGAGTWSNVTKVNGTSIPVNSAADQVLGTTAGATGAWASVPNCGDSVHALAYSTATHSYSCQAITPGAGGSSGQLQYNNGGALGGVTVGGDGTLNAATGALAVTKTNGVAFANSATIDATNASNISSGTLAASRLPAALANSTSINGTAIPSSSTLMTTGMALAASQEPAHIGDVTNSAGSLTLTAWKINGTSVPVNAAADQTIVTTAAATSAWASVPSCGDSAHALAYSTATHSYSCQAITAGAGGTSGQLQYNNGGALGGVTVGGDGTLNAGTGALTVTKTNGVAFANSATTDTTNALNISSGTLSASRLPAALANSTSINGTAIPASSTLMTTGTALAAAQEPAHTGDVTNSAGSLALTAGRINGTSVPVNAAADQTIVTTTAAAGSWTSIPNCGDNSHALSYSTATHTYSCQSITGSSGGMADPGGNGVVVRTALNTTTGRIISGAAGISVLNGDGVAGNPTITADTAVVLSRATHQAGTDLHCADASLTATHACSLIPALTTYTTGGAILFCAGSTQNGLQTLNINSVGSRKLFAADGVSNPALTQGRCTGFSYDAALDGGFGGFRQNDYPGGGGGGGGITALTGDVAASGSGSVAATIQPGAVSSSKMAAANTRRTCIIDNDTQSATALAAGNFSGRCTIPMAATIVEVDLLGGTGVVSGAAAAPAVSGTGSVQLGKYTPSSGASVTGLLSAPVGTMAGKACVLPASAGACINGNTSVAATVSTTGLAAGDVLYVSAATPDATQTWYQIAVIYTVN